MIRLLLGSLPALVGIAGCVWVAVEGRGLRAEAERMTRRPRYPLRYGCPDGTCPICGMADDQLVEAGCHLDCTEWLGWVPGGFVVEQETLPGV